MLEEFWSSFAFIGYKQTFQMLYLPLSNPWPHSSTQSDCGMRKIKPSTTTNQLLSLSLRGRPPLNKIQPQSEAEPVMMVWAGLCLGGVHSVNTNLLPLIPINAGGSKGHLQMLYWYWIRAGCCVPSGLWGQQCFTLAVCFWPQCANVRVCCIFWEWAHLRRTAKFSLLGSRISLLCVFEKVHLGQVEWCWWCWRRFTSHSKERWNVFNITTTSPVTFYFKNTRMTENLRRHIKRGGKKSWWKVQSRGV